MRHLRGLDEMVLETAFVGLSSLVFLVVLAFALNSEGARRLESLPIAGQIVGGLRALVGQVVNPVTP